VGSDAQLALSSSVFNASCIAEKEKWSEAKRDKSSWLVVDK
jgi:hypothetical protein